MSEVKALSGHLVLALEQAVAAPFCSSRLADAGARVIKIERAEGDFARGYDSVVNGQSAYFVWLNRGKESICINLKDAQDQALLQRMVDHADVFIQNLAPGAASRAGFNTGQLRDRNPRLVTVDISGYGDFGSYSGLKAYDLLIQCESGLASLTGCESGPGRVGVSVCDIACGMYAYSAVLQALIERARTGLGKSIKVSLFDAIADWMTVPLLQFEYSGVVPKRLGLNHPTIAPYGVYLCQGGFPVVIAIQNQREWRAFCEVVLLLPELIVHEKFRSNQERVGNRSELDSEICRVFGCLTKDQLVHRLRSGNIAFGFVNTVSELSAHEQLRRVKVLTEAGAVQVVAPPPMASGSSAQFGPVPALNEHGEKLRAEFSR